jgi:hypothetical protein
MLPTPVLLSACSTDFSMKLWGGPAARSAPLLRWHTRSRRNLSWDDINSWH